MPVARVNVDLIKDILDQLAAQQEGYQCRQCGFRGQALHWQCPACHGWITMQPASCAVAPHTLDDDVFPDRKVSAFKKGSRQ